MHLVLDCSLFMVSLFPWYSQINLPDAQGDISAKSLVNTYDLIELGQLANLPSCQTTGLNDLGMIVGECCADNQQICDCGGFLWIEGNMYVITPPNGRTGVTPLAINNSADIVGLSWVCSDTNRAYLQRASQPIDLNDWLPAGSTWLLTRAVDINELGHITGWAKIAGEVHGFFYDGAQFYDLGDLGGPGSFPTAINDNDQIVGGSWNSQNEYRAFLWDQGQMIELPVFPQDVTGVQANDINNQGQVIGYYIDLTGLLRFGFLWENGKAIALANGNNINSVPLSINEAGIIVGWGDQYTQYYFDVASMWRSSNKLIEVETLVRSPWIYEVGTASQVNELGWIAGFSRVSAGLQFHPFVLIPREGKPSIRNVIQ